MRISTDRGMVRLDLCVDYNGGMVSVCSTERCRGRGPGLWIRRDAESWGWVGPDLWTRWGAERLGWVCVLLQGWGERLGGWGGGGGVLGSEGTETECGSLFLNQHRLGPLCRGACPVT